MAPKPTVGVVRTTTTLAYLLQSGVAHSLKDLEKALPPLGVAGVHLKEILTSLVEENKVKVEKCGTGNWYWCFAQEERAGREAEISKLEAEQTRTEGEIARLERELQQAEQQVQAGKKDQPNDLSDKRNAGEESRARDLRAEIAETDAEVARLERRLAALEKKQPTTLAEKKAVIEELKDDADRWTDQVLMMEDWIRNMLAVDGSTFSEYKREWYGEEWNEDEDGLCELF